MNEHLGDENHIMFKDLVGSQCGVERNSCDPQASSRHLKAIVGPVACAAHANAIVPVPVKAW